MEINKSFAGAYLKMKIGFLFLLFALCNLPFAFRLLQFALCLLPFTFCFSQNVDSIPFFLKSTNDANERVLLLTDYATRKINLNEFIQAKKSAEKAFEIAKNSEFNFGKATALTRIGEIDAKQNDFATAYKHFHEAEQIFLKDGDKTDCAQLYNGWAQSALLYKKPDDAIKFASSGLNFYVFDSQMPYFESELHKTLGESWLQKNQQGRALGEFDESLKLLHENSVPDAIKSKLTFDVANLFLETKNYDDALTFFNAALSADLKINDSLRIASDKFYLAKCHLKLKEIKTAMSYGTQSLVYFENHNDTVKAANNHLLLAEIYLRDGSKAKANNELTEAENLITRLPLENSNLITINELSRLYGKLGDRKKEKLYLLKYASYKENSKPINGDIFTINSEEKSVTTKQSFLQNLKSKIDTKLFIILFGLASILATIFLFPRPKKQLSLSSPQIAESNEPLALLEETLTVNIEPIFRVEPLTLINNQLKERVVENSISQFLNQLAAKLKIQDLLSTDKMFFKEDDNFLIHSVQQKNIEILLESIFNAAKINFGEPIASLKFSKSDVEAHSFTLKTIIELPNDFKKENVFKSILTSNQTDSSLNSHASEFIKQLAKTNSSAIFANLVATNYLIIFTEVFDISE